MDHTYYFAESSNSNLPRINNHNDESHRICSVPQCNNRTCGDRNISLHRFPKDPNVLMKWIYLFKLGKLPKYAFACSDHFCSDDFISSAKSKRRLKPQAIPSQKLPMYSAQVLKKQAQKENRQEWGHRQQLFYEKIFTRPTESSSIPEIVVPKAEPVPLIKEAELPIARKKDVSVQVETVVPRLPTEDRPKIMNLIQSDAHMQLCTNLTIKQFHTICEMVKRFVCQIPIIRSEELGVSSKILLTLMKLKENHSFSHLSFLFDVTVASCSSTFCEMIGILRQVLCQFITWPSKEEIRRHLPKQFSNWPHTRVVIDCIEIEVYSSSCLQCRNSFCSHSKNKPTIKFLVGMAPSGHVTFLTDVYDGETPAKTILDVCGLLNLCEPGDTIIANRGFVMDEPCQAAEKPASQPSMLGEQSQFPNKEVEDIKPVVANIRPVVTSTRPVVTSTRPVVTSTRPVVTSTRLATANTRPVPGDTKSVAASTKPLPENTKSVPKNIKPAATITKPLPENTRTVPRNITPAATNTRPVAVNTIPTLANTKPVARAKVHIKTMERIKTYEIINSPITSEMFNGIDMITNVICALVNFTTPLVSYE